MKLFVISDIHGSVYYLKKALNKFNESKSDLLVILGDILYHGPRNPLPDEYNPKEVVKLLDEYRNKGAEGLMCNTNKTYEFKRSKGCLKLKVMQTIFCRILKLFFLTKT